MKKLILLAFFASTTALAAPWHDRMVCRGTFLSSNDFLVEISPATDQSGLLRQVHFQKNYESPDEFVTDKCQLKGKFLICNSRKINITVNVQTVMGHRGYWDAASYNYYPAEVVRIGFFGNKTENLRCKL